jgi:flagellar assembly protein FliH
LEKGLDEARKVLKQFEKAVEDAVAQRIELLEEAKQKILEMVIQISRKVTFDALQIDPETTMAMIEGVINQLVDRSRLRIKVHPTHLPQMEQSMNRFLSSSTSIKELTFEADPRVRIGGCFIETPTGDIDARITSQFDVIEDALRGGTEDA